MLTIIHPLELGTFLGLVSAVSGVSKFGMMWNMVLVKIDHANE